MFSRGNIQRFLRRMPGTLNQRDLWRIGDDYKLVSLAQLRPLAKVSESVEQPLKPLRKNYITCRGCSCLSDRPFQALALDLWHMTSAELPQ